MAGKGAERRKKMAAEAMVGVKWARRWRRAWVLVEPVRELADRRTMFRLSGADDAGAGKGNGRAMS